jgi:hypothetical protein
VLDGEAMKIRKGSRVIIKMHDGRVLDAIVSRVDTPTVRGTRVIALSGKLLVNVGIDQVEKVVKY